ncbi:MAG TPA: GNVR domain-containing protein [Vicinamibacteria bacterium]|nr:GNVR domain-containing protein [Vicinamibacteria bacterium]
MMEDDAEIQAPPGRDPLEYLEAPLRYPGAMWLTFLAVLAVGLVLASVFPRKYRSATLILVEPNKVPDYFVTPMASETVDKRLQTIRQVILSRTRLESVVQETDPYPEMAKMPSAVVVETMRRAIQIRVQGNDSFSIEYVNENPRKAAEVTNRLAQQFISDTQYLRDTVTQRTFNFIESNLDDARRALETREAALRQLKQQHWGALPEQLETSLRLLSQLQFEQQTLGENLRTLDARRTSLERSLVELKQAQPDASAQVGPRDQLAKLQAQYAALRDRYTEEHPDVRALRLRIARLEELASQPAPQPAITSRADSDPQLVPVHRSLQQVETEIAALDEKREGLDQRIADLQARIEKTPAVEQELKDLTRDYQQMQENYLALLRKDNDARMARKMEAHWQGNYFRILDPAPVPERPIRPYGVMFGLGGLVGGLLAGIAASLLADFLDHSVKSRREVEVLVAAPVLAEIPHLRTGRSALLLGRRS